MPGCWLYKITYDMTVCSHWRSSSNKVRWHAEGEQCNTRWQHGRFHQAFDGPQLTPVTRLYVHLTAIISDKSHRWAMTIHRMSRSLPTSATQCFCVVLKKLHSPYIIQSWEYPISFSYSVVRLNIKITWEATTSHVLLQCCQWSRTKLFEKCIMPNNRLTKFFRKLCNAKKLTHN